MRSRVVADLRKHRGDARNIVGLVGAFASGKEADVYWLLRQDQAQLSPPGQVIGQADYFDGTWAAQVRERIAQLAQNESGASFWVFSYDASVRAEAEKLNQMGISVTSRSPAELIAQASMQRRNYSELPIANTQSGPQSRDGNLTISEAIAIAKQALKDGGHTSPETALKEALLRPRMVGIDSRARRVPGNPTSEAMITSIVTIGRREGWLNRFRRVEGQSGTEVVYFAEAVEVVPAPTRDAPKVDLGIHGVEKVPDSQRAGPSGPKKHPNRATPFEQELSKLRIGSMPETRVLVMDAVASTLNECPEKPMLAALFAKATARAKTEAAHNGYVTERNWPIAIKCIQRLMLWAGVILDEQGNPVRDRIGSASSRVFDLAPDFRRKCEAYIAREVISRLGGISFDDDLYYLGLVLYRRGKEKAVASEDLKAKTDELLAFMQGNGDIEMGDDRIIRATDSTPLTGNFFTRL